MFCPLLWFRQVLPRQIPLLDSRKPKVPPLPMKKPQRLTTARLSNMKKTSTKMKKSYLLRYRMMMYAITAMKAAKANSQIKSGGS